jgi:hypothetical protein
MRTRTVPIDYLDIMAQSGCTKGNIVYSSFADSWGVQNGNGDSDFCCIDPPPFECDEKAVKIEHDAWTYYN